MNAQRIAIITDSGTDTDPAFCREHDIRVMPLHINYSDGSSFSSGVDISSAEVVRRFADEIPKTSLPSPHEIETTLRKAKADGYERAVVVTIASALSATNHTVQMVADQLEDFPVLVIDTKSIGMMAGMVVRRATALVEEGVPFAELDGRLQGVIEDTDVFFAVKSLDYLHEGGRINAAIYRLGSILNIKPVLTCNREGYYTMAKKARGWERALEAMVRLVAERANRFERVRLAVCFTQATARLRDVLEERVRAQVKADVVEFLSQELQPDLMVHTGPDLVGMGVQGA
ncbi:DegV family protein [Olsenella massiliensis]|uniref:DegV family protein n=1 Tax=Olsenella massiliensis TaxID=1622075 RepID=UPI00071CD175|nr:DegV family protein [Olsenella massiliensis]